MRALHEHGYDLPSEFSIIALNDGLLASLVFPQMTTVAMRSLEMGSRAAMMLIDQLSSGGEAAMVVLEPGRVIARGSVAPPPCMGALGA
jgi:LacI family transcriptional regulator